MEFILEKTAEAITLETPAISVGGEAYLYTVAGQDDLLAKIYHRPTVERAEKLAMMIAQPPADPMVAHNHPSIAWPRDRILTPDEQQCVGFVMPRVRGMRSIFEFYNPRTRRQYCPLFHYGYLIRTARNLAAAFHALHDRGYVVGDDNESNILVNDSALVTLVDTDSFQVTAGSRIYRCPVGKPEFTPPELQDVRFREVDRRPEHDTFGLSVVIFLLLMEGTHPFAGRLTSGGEPATLGDRIAANYYPYQSGRQIPYEPMPTAPPIGLLHPELRALLRLAFDAGHHDPSVRPSAAKWQAALDIAERNIRHCSDNPQHFYRAGMGACPWCERTALFGRDPFPSREAVKRGEHLPPPPVTYTESVPVRTAAEKV